ncbi:DUF2087 domain-containing protein [Brevibacterium casei]|uniref:DUF2087 domain-containing protein n=1 Tax=Brevibacterium casei TaxID=33889 RepID=A0A165D0C3_9MICO|nr:DUF2087 domain-containing protein [Brevibacterium casei]KZE09943.1 hypothetical protein AVW13_03265 [Brevibacterium casei]MDH5150403.1 DUF2087 domain-containing protein [Brevibacterium casei]QPS32512.1 DUF2087 domain-containing protein [Brevibacterium casei]QQT68178.1 DUF2087 domain-containing protein [Brevibacterium casei]
MTKNSDFKSLIRARMAETGENYTSARAALLTENLVRQTEAPDLEAQAALERYKNKVRATFVKDGAFTAIPTKRRALVVLLLDIRTSLDADRVYTEKELNAYLGRFHPDFARLRRELIDYRYLERNAHTGEYWIAAELPERRGFMIEEAGVLEDSVR